MKKLFFALSALAVSFFPLLTSAAKAEYLYRRYPQGGRFGGSAYTDSNGNIDNDAPCNQPGLYGGGVIYDSDMNAYDCGVTGQCWKR